MVVWGELQLADSISFSKGITGGGVSVSTTKAGWTGYFTSGLIEKHRPHGVANGLEYKRIPDSVGTTLFDEFTGLAQ